MPEGSSPWPASPGGLWHAPTATPTLYDLGMQPEPVIFEALLPLLAQAEPATFELQALLPIILAFLILFAVLWAYLKSRVIEVAKAPMPTAQRNSGSASVHLDDAGGTRIAVIKEVRIATGLNLRDAKNLVDRADGVEVLSGVSRAQAELVKAKLEAVGAQARVVDSDASEGGTVVARLGQSRCPYCHEDASGADLVACTACMAKHHEACWDEHTQCSACGNPERFAGIEHTGGRERRPDSLKE